MPDLTPVLNHANFEADSTHADGRIHRRKQDGNSNDLTTIGYVRGDQLKIGLAVNVKKDVVNWTGTIVSGPHWSPMVLAYYWTFHVTPSDGEVDPVQDDTVTVTVTNPAATPSTSNSQTSDPQPTVVEP